MSDLPIISLTELPLILAGPILRRTTPRSVTVWVALQVACRVELRVLATEDNGNQIGESLLSGSRETIALGPHLHIIAVTATAEGSLELAADRVYAYDLIFSDGNRQIPDRSLQQAISVPHVSHDRISYFAHGYPTFVLPSSQISDLRIVHGSCRKPHGEGFDALSILDSLLAESADLPSQRPQQLFLTGDQIYGDDVAEPLLWAASQLSETLLGWTERLPVRNPSSRQIEYRLVNEFAPGLRAEIATRQAGFTAGLRDRRKKVTSHLFSLGEYYAVYLLACSPVCWPQRWPSGGAVTKDRHVAKQWERDLKQLQKFVEGLGRVRRALANIPMYAIFDDHDVSDDWNLNQAWCLRVLGKPLGKQVVQNALLAYAIFQGWGNTPDRFEAGTSGGKLLAAAQKWSLSRGTDLAANLEIARLVGMPQSDSRTGLPKFTLDGEVAILDRDPEALTWHYTIASNCHEVMVLDTRTWRGYHLDRSPIEPPMLLSPTAFERQLIEPLQAKSPTAAPVATFIVAPTNLFGLKIIDRIHKWSLERNRVFATDVGDAWNIHTPALAQLITTLFAHRDTVVVLSGDIHYGAVVRLSHLQLDTAGVGTRGRGDEGRGLGGIGLIAKTHDSSLESSQRQSSLLVQLTASALRNEEPITKLLHTRLKEWLFPEKIRYSLGWDRPPEMLAFRSRLSRRDRQNPHDWECVLEWIPRQQTTVASFERKAARERGRLTQRNVVGGRLSHVDRDRVYAMPTRSIAGNFQLKPYVQRLMWWKSRWFQDGREVVGLNNLAVVRWQSQTIVQDLYWRAPWLPTPIVYSRFIATLDRDNNLSW
ncbi:hypothetical protein [Chamaesiphon minutus]|uniref:PhoD-like phosphatase n=1 Tax=Chamaesiphon minutus (strain ATCC 27169 / PCC 6605) TaxID=1173020 RepID=K9UCC1_CHAP6|nr:hypothetical protein [Chamaesiphon minutus]AFY92480.1 hypothetical protein Cha6605_1277 [Chamaesiphon minutus PCC 6605]